MGRRKITNATESPTWKKRRLPRYTKNNITVPEGSPTLWRGGGWSQGVVHSGVFRVEKSEFTVYDCQFVRLCTDPRNFGISFELKNNRIRRMKVWNATEQHKYQIGTAPSKSKVRLRPTGFLQAEHRSYLWGEIRSHWKYQRNDGKLIRSP